MTLGHLGRYIREASCRSLCRGQPTTKISCDTHESRTCSIQILSGYGQFFKHYKKFGRAEDARGLDCNNGSEDNSKHMIYECGIADSMLRLGRPYCTSLTSSWRIKEKKKERKFIHVIYIYKCLNSSSSLF